MRHPTYILVLLWGSLALGQEGPSGDPGGLQLEYAFEQLAGKTAHYEVETEQRVASELAGKIHLAPGEAPPQRNPGGEVRTLARELQEHSFTRGNEGRGRVVVTTKQLTATVEQPGKRIHYDSSSGRAAPRQLASLATRIDRPVTLHVTRQGEVTRVEGAKGSAAEGYERSFLLLPERPLRFGDSWERVDRQPMPPLGTLVYTFRYRLVGLEEEGTRVRIEARVGAELEEPSHTQRLKAELTAQEGRGYLLLDRQGLVVESLLESSLELTIHSPTGVQIQRIRNKNRQKLSEIVTRSP